MGPGLRAPTPLQRALGLGRVPVLVVALAGALLFFVPFLVVVATSWTGGSFILFPPEGFSLQWYAEVLGNPEWMDAFTLSLWVSAVAAAIAVAVGTVGALALTRLRSATARRWLRTLFIVPMAIPPVAYAVSLFAITLHVEVFDDNLVLLILGESLLAVPYVFVLVAAGLSHTDPALRPAAATLGASWPLIIWRIDLPLVLPNIAAGALFAFSVVFDEVVLSVFLTPVGVTTLPLQMLTASQEAFSPELTAASTMVSLLALLIFGVFTLLSSRAAARARRTARKAAAA